MNLLIEDSKKIYNKTNDFKVLRSWQSRGDMINDDIRNKFITKDKILNNTIEKLYKKNA